MHREFRGVVARWKPGSDVIRHEELGWSKAGREGVGSAHPTHRTRHYNVGRDYTVDG